MLGLTVQLVRASGILDLGIAGGDFEVLVQLQRHRVRRRVRRRVLQVLVRGELLGVGLCRRGVACRRQ